MGYLNDWWRDTLTLAGLVGTVATLIGLYITVYQVTRSRRVAESVDRAVRQSLGEMRQAYEQYALGNCRNYLNLAKLAADAGEWSACALRLGDLADECAELGRLDHVEGGATLADVGGQARDWENTFRRIHRDDTTFRLSAQRKWNDFTRLAAAGLDRRYGPLAAVLIGENHGTGRETP